MEKEEILAKAQKENKGADIADLEAQRKGTNIWLRCSMLSI